MGNETIKRTAGPNGKLWIKEIIIRCKKQRIESKMHILKKKEAFALCTWCALCISIYMINKHMFIFEFIISNWTRFSNNVQLVLVSCWNLIGRNRDPFVDSICANENISLFFVCVCTFSKYVNVFSESNNYAVMFISGRMNRKSIKSIDWYIVKFD